MGEVGVFVCPVAVAIVVVVLVVEIEDAITARSRHLAEICCASRPTDTFPARLSTKIILPAVNIGCFRPSSHESKMTGNTYNVS